MPSRTRSFPSNPSLRDDGYPTDWSARRRATFERDNHRCQECGARGGSRGDATLNAHHVTPKSRGGSHALSNLQTLCYDCHASKHPHMSSNTEVSTAVVIAIFVVGTFGGMALAVVLRVVLPLFFISVALGAFALAIAGAYWALNVVVDTREYNVAPWALVPALDQSPTEDPAFQQVMTRVGIATLAVVFLFINLVISSFAGRLVFLGLALALGAGTYHYREELRDSGLAALPERGSHQRSWDEINAEMRPPMESLIQRFADRRLLIGTGVVVYALVGGAVISVWMKVPLNMSVSVAIVAPLICWALANADEIET